MEEIDFVVEMEPIVQKRARATTVGGKVRMYDPSSKDKSKFLDACLDHAPAEPFEGPVSVSIEAGFTRPKSHYGTGKNANKLKPSAPEFHTQKCDVDNIAKIKLDALNGVFWTDDRVIDQLIVTKRWAEEGYTRMTITGTYE